MLVEHNKIMLHCVLFHVSKRKLKKTQVILGKKKKNVSKIQRHSKGNKMRHLMLKLGVTGQDTHTLWLVPAEGHLGA